MTWRSFPDTPLAYDGPSPAQIEQATDDVFAGDYAAMVQVYRTILEMKAEARALRPGSELLAKVSYVLATDDALSHEVATLTFADQWGVPAVLRALARAIEQHTAHEARPSAETVE